MPAATIDVYRRLLADLPPGDVAAAIDRLVCTSPFPPTIAEIRADVVERRLELPSIAEAVAALRQTQQAEGGVRDGMHPLVYQARQTVGDGWAWRTTEQPGILVAQARKVYEELRGEAVRAELVGDVRAEALDS